MNGKKGKNRNFGKKWLCGLLCIAMICGFTACGSWRHEELKADESTFLVEFQLESEDEIAEIRFDYYLGDTAVGGGSVSNADQSLMSTDDQFVWDFTTDDFPEDAKLSDFGMRIMVVDENGYDYPCNLNGTLRIEAQYGSSYQVLISGGFGDGFLAKEVE